MQVMNLSGDSCFKTRGQSDDLQTQDADTKLVQL
jgi:hypothetical protein